MDTYITQFKLLVQLNYCTEVDKSALPAVSQREVALMVLSNILAECPSTYRAPVTALDNHFGTAPTKLSSGTKSKSKRSESLAELMKDNG